jgi:hypothetical protein
VHHSSERRDSSFSLRQVVVPPARFLLLAPHLIILQHPLFENVLFPMNMAPSKLSLGLPGSLDAHVRVPGNGHIVPRSQNALGQSFGIPRNGADVPRTHQPVSWEHSGYGRPVVLRLL